MKNVIYTYYNILLDEINKDGNNYFFYFNNDLYIFYLVLNDIKVVESVYKFIKENNVDSFEIILNKEGKLFCDVENKKYSLIKIKGILKYEIKFEEFKFYPVDSQPNNWAELWSKRLDYYEIQLRELGYNYQTVLNSFGMFAGMAENAILYFNISKKKFNDNEIVGVVHNRMNYPCYLIDYNNPLNFVIDYNVRDIAEYIKSYLLSDDYEINNVLVLLDRLSVNNLMFNLLYSRLMYPTFYFDVFDKIILEDGKDSDIVGVLNVVDKYIEMLNKVYLTFKEKYNMLNVEWINKIKNVEN